ncbi:MAG: Fmu (Sun) domain-containing protein [Desulfovibrio sp.]|jgi:16S rRNA (cytosine967-C5)-methyltransferase|nr:Fmu (Sun) domain-containing protein [Desulfovibrio sp.]
MAAARFKLHKAGNDPRAAAVQALFRVVYEGEDSQAALDTALASPHLAPVDGRLCTELLYGTLRRFLSLRVFIRNFLVRPEKIPQEMELTLILALYEMAFLRSPHHAAVGWAVSHIRNRFGRIMGGVGNAVLRKAQRSLPDYGLDPERRGSLRSSLETDSGAGADLPDWMTHMWRENYGEAASLALTRAACLEPPAGLRLNRAAEGWEDLRAGLLAACGQSEGRPVSDPEDVAGRHILAFFSPVPAAARRAVQQGRVSRQSAAAAAALNFFSPGDWPRPIWDCCAGRGGKTLSLLEQGVEVRLASDISSRRLDGLAHDYVRLGVSVPCPRLLRLDLTELHAEYRPEGEAPGGRREEEPGVFSELFGTILLDAPCSGLGTLSRRPEIRLRRDPQDVEKLAELQALMLKNLWPRLMPGGRLIYLTCTVSPAENEGQIAAFLASTPDASLGREFRTPFSSPLREFFYGAQLEKSL